MPPALNDILPFKIAVPVIFLSLLWAWESWRPFFRWRGARRWRHAGRNITIAVANTVVLALVFGTTTFAVSNWAASAEFGLLHHFKAHPAVEFAFAILILDGWMYLWHRANHRVPFLWRFHRMHHSDTQMDVTTATRFHLGEHLGAFTLRLAVVALGGLGIWHVIAYEFGVIAFTQFHHANISLGRADRILRLLVVTPDMHKVHHSRLQPETDSNYSTIFSLWDRIGRSLKIRKDPDAIQFGLDEFKEDRWQSVPGMLNTPFRSASDLKSNRLPRRRGFSGSRTRSGKGSKR